ncbi:MAG: protochlorophyllide reductase iron-sulfur ATP-binding protein [Methanosaeta sp. PtaU1.Bin112]|nr:MAG: protochlorophyllide reductase iron-sulfur ATP-binding protein [Methanosaeta sp. PtaU1.Bin112]
MKRVIFTGKGGVGKTTILSNLARLLVRDGCKVLVIDCDPSMNLAMSLGIPMSEIVTLADDKTSLQEQLGVSLEEHHHTSKQECDHHIQEFIMDASDGVKLIVMGTIPFGGAGCICSHISLVKLLVSYLSAGTEEYDFIFIDSQAGVEIFGRGLASEFDDCIVITEPTPKSLEVAKHGSKLSRDLGVRRQIAVINKVENDDDIRFCMQELGGNVDCIISMPFCRDVKEADRCGTALMDYNPKSDALKEFLRIKDCIMER